MKLKNLIFATLVSAFSLSTAFAQTGVKTGTPYGSGEDSIRCLNNVSLLSNNGKNKNYAEAEKFWKQAYEECPGAHKNIYIYGAKILDWKISQETDSAKKVELINKLMKMYDDRAKYFGNDSKYGKDYITTQKAADYIRLMGANAKYGEVYNWLKDVVNNNKENTSAQTLYYYTYASLMKAIEDDKFGEQYVNDYMTCTKYMDHQLANAANQKDKEEVESYKEPMDDLFARSGLASCEMLSKLYTDADIDAHKADTTYLKTIAALFQESECESPLYYKAAKYLFDLKPSAKSAIGLGYEALSKKDYNTAVEYLNKAVSLSKDAKERSTCYYALGVIKMKQNSYAAARDFCRKALAENPSKGEAYILIATMYASSANNIFPSDPVKQRCVYYLVVDQLMKAKNADPSIAGKVNPLIARYSRNFPAASDIFMHPDLDKGKSFTVGGWIGESTVIR